MKISVVTTLYNSGNHLREFYSRIMSSAGSVSEKDVELILVNDDSPDNSLQVAKEIADEDSRVVVVDLSRNFGQHKAIMSGLGYATGDRVFLIDCDLEEEPELVTFFTKYMNSEDCDVVYGVQAERRGGAYQKYSGLLFYKFLNNITSLNVSEGLVTARLMTRRYVDALLLHKEREVFLAGLWHITGFTQKPVEIVKKNSSPTNYTFRMKISQLVNSVTSFSNAPLVFIFYFGVFISTLAGTYIAYLVYLKIILATSLGGWTSVMASIWLLGGLIISFIGIIGIYLSKIYSETKQRPYTIVREIYSSKDSKK